MYSTVNARHDEERSLLHALERELIELLAAAAALEEVGTIGELDAAICATAAELSRRCDARRLLELAREEPCLFATRELQQPAEAVSPVGLLQWNVYCHLRRAAWLELVGGAQTSDSDARACRDVHVECERMNFPMPSGLDEV